MIQRSNLCDGYFDCYDREVIIIQLVALFIVSSNFLIYDVGIFAWVKLFFCYVPHRLDFTSGSCQFDFHGPSSSQKEKCPYNGYFQV